MAQSDPENKACEIGSPYGRVIHAGGANAIEELIKPGKEKASYCDRYRATQCDVIIPAGYRKRPHDVIVDVGKTHLFTFRLHWNQLS